MREEKELTRLIAEQSALRRIATLVAAGIGEKELVDALTFEIGSLFSAQRANTMRWTGEAIEVIGEWSSDGSAVADGRVFEYGGDTLVTRVVRSRAPARVDAASDFETDFARERWRELGIEASIAAPIIVGSAVWGVVTASRTTKDDPFAEGAESRLADFAALVAQSIVNAQARQEATALAEEQAALRRVATLVAAGRPQEEVVEAVTQEAANLFEAENVSLMRWEGVQDEVVVVGGWSQGGDSMIEAGSLYHPAPGSPTLRVLETGYAMRKDELSGELGARFAISAPVIVSGRLWGALTALRPGSPFSAASEVRLRSFADLAAQSVANALAQAEMRASRARIVRAGDEERKRLERNLHDGAQQRLVATSITLRLAAAKLPKEADDVRSLLETAADELTHAIEELRVVARGIHPAILTDRGLGSALEALAERTPLPVTIANELPTRLPAAVEAAAYYVVAESLTNVVRYADASVVEVRLTRNEGLARVEIMDDGIGGADPSRGSGLRGLADRVEALDGRLGVESPLSAGTRIWAEIPLQSTSPD
jgi:signal transduction histidine kinase